MRARKGAERRVFEGERLRVEALRPALRQVAPQTAGEAASDGEFARRGEHARLGEVGEAAVVVDVQVGQHDRAHVIRPDAERAKLGADLLLAFDIEAHAGAEIRVPLRQRLEPDIGARIDQDDAVAMLDRVDIDRQPI